MPQTKIVLLHHNKPTSTNNQAPSEGVINTTNSNIKRRENVILPVIAVHISNHNCTVTISALLGSGADSTIIYKVIVAILELQETKCQLTLSSSISTAKNVFQNLSVSVIFTLTVKFNKIIKRMGSR